MAVALAVLPDLQLEAMKKEERSQPMPELLELERKEVPEGRAQMDVSSFLSHAP